MKVINQTIVKAAIFIGIATFVLSGKLQAQRFNNLPGGGTGKAPVSKQGSVPSQPLNGGTQNMTAPKSSPNAASTGTGKPTGVNNNSTGTNKPAATTGSSTNVSTGNTNNVSTGNNTSVSGNNVNVNNSTNVNVNNSKTTVVVVKPGPKPYPKPPYMYGGYSYYCYHPYYYHPYHPYPYPAYHPAGFYVVVVPTTAVIVPVQSQTYYNDQGIYYMPSNGGYVVVPAPVGATVTTLPPATQTVVVTETTNNYYYGGTYYEKSDKGYVVVPPTAGCVVENLPQGGVETKVGDVTYVKVGETYYQPIQKNGKNMYEVVEVKAGT